MNKNIVYNQLIEVGTSLIQQYGFNAFSFKDLAVQLGIKTSSVHYYFPTKIDFVCKVVKRYSENMELFFQNLSNGPDIDLALFFQKITETTLSAENKMCLGGILASEMLSVNQAVQEVVKQLFIVIENGLIKILEQGKAENLFHFTEPVVTMAHIIVSNFEGALLLARLYHDPKRLETTFLFIKHYIFKT